MSDIETQEFEAAWKQASGSTEEPVTPAPANDGDDDSAAAAAAADKPEEGKEAAEANSQDGAAAEQPPANTDNTEPDIWADAPEHLRSAYEAERDKAARLEHQRKSDDGRVSSFQRRSDELRRQVAAIRTVGEQEDIQAYLNSDEYKKSKDEYGADLGPIFQLVEGLAKNTTTNAQQIGQVSTTTISEIEAKVESLLDEEAPDRVNLITDERFMPWLEAQPSFVKRLATNNWEKVSDPAELVELCNRFRDAHGIEMPTVTTAPAEQAAQPTETSRKRELQLEGSRSTTSSRQPIANPGADEDDFEGAWKEAAAAKKRA